MLKETQVHSAVLFPLVVCSGQWFSFVDDRGFTLVSCTFLSSIGCVTVVACSVCVCVCLWPVDKDDAFGGVQALRKSAHVYNSMSSTQPIIFRSRSSKVSGSKPYLSGRAQSAAETRAGVPCMPLRAVLEVGTRRLQMTGRWRQDSRTSRYLSCARRFCIKVFCLVGKPTSMCNTSREVQDIRRSSLAAYRADQDTVHP